MGNGRGPLEGQGLQGGTVPLLTERAHRNEVLQQSDLLRAAPAQLNHRHADPRYVKSIAQHQRQPHEEAAHAPSCGCSRTQPEL